MTMSRPVRARAWANIALVKYWGKREGAGNVPATPSISLALDGLLTETELSPRDSDEDSFIINDDPISGTGAAKLARYLDLWRNDGHLEGAVEVRSRNSFPTAAGLASSASGFAALATALNELTGTGFDRDTLSRMARRGSASAARSIPGGVAEMPLGEDPASTLLLPSETLPWGMVVAVVKAPGKEIGSTEGMEMSRTSSPLYDAWLESSEVDFAKLRSALLAQDLQQVGEIAEANMYAMHSVMFSTRPALQYWSETTLSLLREIRAWRSKGLATWATVDAGPHVAFLAHKDDLEKIVELAEQVPGVVEALSCGIAPGSEVVA